MRKLNMLSILSALALLLLAPCPAAALLIPEAAEIPYQINTSDRIVIGTVSGIDVHYDHTIFTITVEEWLYNSLPAETIKVRTETGKYVWTEDQAEFTLNESVLLMLRDEEPDEQLFSVSGGFPGKHPVSDRGAVIEELKVQGKWQDENRIENTETASEQPADSNSPSDTKSTPFTGILWVVMAVIGAFVCTGKKK
ncbi:hypothetical protein EO95_16135 [Methanosarcina sp. 1.H.T.1A.1]|uniref:hypothetical protein n=1 Tax=Methanosarcina sp. 1.H.T.1A.1 TaxID=1483602 RepID=UPI000621234D|nr:hypothetical protein [Methanosarcina sp. 1.H.T.1A.1]KKH96293.1 hypothetical protein EO95_16135 [Methanosarcina sp. 1.H.T.1A.1]